MLTFTTRTLIFALLLSLICNHAADCQTRNLTARSIVKRMSIQYARASSYQDTGVAMIVTGDNDGQSRRAIKFKTYFARPQFFRFEWRGFPINTPEETFNIVWSNGKQTFSYYSWDNPAVEKKEDIGLGIASAVGVAGGAAETVPSLLIREIGMFRLTEMTKLTIVGEENFEGEDCYIIRGYHPFNFPIDIWISKRDFLLRKEKEPGSDGSYEIEIHRDIKLNEKIPPKLFDYTPPSPKPRYRPQTGI
jgi:outer membrane lipoprotein-sorting protein